ncbi:MAG: DnaJ domain-containing protein [Polyangiaceae bacterium]|nr:DnaJ domain-containing protein [Polyangiaceae bacterium]
MSSLFAPVCSITRTSRGRCFWAAWWSSPPAYVPFRKPDAEGGAATTRQAARAAAEQRAGSPLIEIDGLWARAWKRMLRGQPPWPSKASREPRAARPNGPARDEHNASIWSVLGVSAHVTDAELKTAYRKKAIETHPDRGGDAEAFRHVVAAYAEARRRLRKPKRRG